MGKIINPHRVNVSINHHKYFTNVTYYSIILILIYTVDGAFALFFECSASNHLVVRGEEKLCNGTQNSKGLVKAVKVWSERNEAKCSLIMIVIM